MNLKTIRDAAETLETNESKVRRAVQSGELSVMMLGNRMLVDIDEARDVLGNQAGVGIEVISAETGLSVGAIRRGIREGWMPCIKPGRAYLFDVDDVRAAIEGRMTRKRAAKR